MDIVGIDISVEPRGSPDKAKFDAALLLGERVRHAVFSNTEAGFQQLLAWLAKHRPDPAAPMHACMEATGNWGLELADFLHAQGVRVSIVNPARIKAYGESELARNKTDKLDAGLIARFCRAHVPPAWVPAAAHLRELRELVRRCDALKAARVQELNRQKSGFASPAVARSIAAHLDWLDRQIETVMSEVRHLIAADPALSRNLALVRSITGFGEVSATILLAELPNVEPKGSPGIAEFTPKALAAFVGLSPPAVFHRLCRRNLDDLRPANTAPAPPCAGQGKSAVSARSACAAHSICVRSAPNGRTNHSPPSWRE